MGISGCGKSLCVKTISTLWNLPLFRLDMNAVFGTDNPEMTFLRALRAVEAVSPAVLWIDEIEMGVGGYREGQDASMSRIFSGFLTWMQEKSALVFVAATANRIHLLPAEIIRKGRFDQVFFVDLPNEEERKQIFAIHLKKNKLRRRAASTSSSSPRRPTAGTAPRSSRPSSRRSSTPTPRSRTLDRGRPLPDDLGDRASLRDDGGADQGDPELGARARAERLAGADPAVKRLLLLALLAGGAFFAYRYAVVDAPVRACGASWRSAARAAPDDRGEPIARPVSSSAGRARSAGTAPGSGAGPATRASGRRASRSATASESVSRRACSSGRRVAQPQGDLGGEALGRQRLLAGAAAARAPAATSAEERGGGAA